VTRLHISQVKQFVLQAVHVHENYLVEVPPDLIYYVYDVLDESFDEKEEDTIDVVIPQKVRNVLSICAWCVNVVFPKLMKLVETPKFDIPKKRFYIPKPQKDCQYCKNEMKTSSVCSRCLQTCYCSKKCQENDWKDHKLVCPKMKRKLLWTNKCCNCSKTLTSESNFVVCPKCRLMITCCKDCKDKADGTLGHTYNCDDFKQLFVLGSTLDSMAVKIRRLKGKKICQNPDCQTATNRTCKCQTAHYCSDTCQKRMWQFHKKECKDKGQKRKEFDDSYSASYEKFLEILSEVPELFRTNVFHIFLSRIRFRKSCFKLDDDVSAYTIF